MTLSSIKFSNVDLYFVKSYLRIDEDFTDDDYELQLFIDVAKSWVQEHTGMEAEELDEIGYSTIIVLKYIADFYTDRGIKYSNKFQIDPVTNMLLDQIRTYNLGSAKKEVSYVGW